MLLPVLISLLLPETQWPPVHEVARDRTGNIVAVANTRENFTRLSFHFLVPGEAEKQPYLMGGGGVLSVWSHPVIDFHRVAGPLAWGVVDGAWYTINHQRRSNPGNHRPELSSDAGIIEAWARGTVISATIRPTAEWIEMERYNRARDFPGDRYEQITRGFQEFGEDHWSYCAPLVEYIIEHAMALADEWDLAFDIVYTSLDDVTAVAVRDRRLMVWELHDTGDQEAPWSAHDPVETTIQGAFRILRAGKDLGNIYIVDSTGAIFTGFGADHRKIGTIANFALPREKGVGLLFEDQQQKKIGAFDVGLDERVSTLDIDWLEEGFAQDFYTTLDDERLKAHLVTMAMILHEKQGEK